ncbi:fumarylacetoacetase [Ferrimonas marina]|uniref:fumarylacetoacetase n=1 Tax=Ferrimonas marina TaxID=299255 RepID=A0A1M5MG90_9GAMM|nr:fumarylacetoacetase [Ferrimonas marina]SHG76266.1 fumarylacetoacetate hydrolase [Ferrimonas marina]
MYQLNETHDPALRSWVAGANRPDGDFPIQNLPFASLRPMGSNQAFRGAVAIGDHALDLAAALAAGVFDAELEPVVRAAAQPKLNGFMALGPEAWSALRLALSRLLREGTPQQAALAPCLLPLSEVEYQLAHNIGDYTDFYTSVHHATAVGRLFRPDNPLLPNYKWVPIGYHGRASSVDVSGQTFHRPCGQLKAPDAAEPSFGPCKRLDYELELGIIIGKGNPLGQPIAIEQAEQHVFGVCVFNDWSARDIQAWEYQPLGPFLSKSFASTVSPWIVTLEALVPFRAGFVRDASDPQPLPYLDSDHNRQAGALDIQLECLLQTGAMAERGESATRLSTSSFRHSYWTVAQMVTHHTVNGCNLQPGDLFGSGTQSGPKPEEAGSLLELSAGGKQAITLANGEQRTFLEDGDTVVMRAHCQREGVVRIGFGEVVSTVLPAKA